MNSVSVCMATYNGEKYINQQVDSILCQLGINDELIVSDDGSTDNTINLLVAYNDDRIKIYRNNKQKGPNGNFENSLEKATGDYIFLADQDDIWFENKIELMKSHLADYDLVICDCRVVDDELKTLADSYFNYINSGAGFIKNLKRNTYMGNCMGFKRDVLKIALPFPLNIPNHDLWLGVVADLFYKPLFIHQVLGLHRRHSFNASNTFDIKIKTSFLRKLQKRQMIISQLPFLFVRRYLGKQ